MKKERSILTTSFIWKFGERFLAQIVSFIVSIVCNGRRLWQYQSYTSEYE